MWKTQSQGDYTNFKTFDSSVFSFVITAGIIEGEYYDVAVQAKNEVGINTRSPSVRIVAAIPPDAPLGLQILQQGSATIDISWFAVTGVANGGSPITYYEAYWKTSTD